MFSKSKLFEKALRGLLRPLVRALIAQSVTAPAFYRIVKRTFVDVAEDELGAAASDSAISLATGVHRRDVKAMRQPETSDEDKERQNFSMLATVVGRWLSDPKLLDANGEPKTLSRSGVDGFDRLVEEVSRDIRPRAVLDELVRQGVARVENTRVMLDPAALVGSANLDQKLHFFSLNVGDHMSAAVENLLAENPPFLERAVFYNMLTQDSVTKIEAETRTVWIDALRRINAFARSLQVQDAGRANATQRFRFGVFFYAQDERVDHERKDKG